MKNVLLIVSIIIFNLSLFSQQYDFRNTSWGASLLQVKLSEKNKLAEETKQKLVFADSLLNINCDVIYEFTNEDKLYNAKYSFDAKLTNYNKYIETYNSLKELLVKKYGIFISDKNTWLNNVKNQNDEELWGQEVAKGNLIIKTTWSFPNKNPYLNISVLLKKEDNGDGILFQIEYVYMPIKKQDEANKLNDVLKSL